MLGTFERYSDIPSVQDWQLAPKGLVCEHERARSFLSLHRCSIFSLVDKLGLVVSASCDR